MKNKINSFFNFRAFALLLSLFTVGSISAQTFTNSTATAIPDNNATGISSTIAVPVTTVVPVAGVTAGNQLVSVTISITHTWNSDLDIYLVGPNNVTLELSTDNGGSSDGYVNAIFNGAVVNPLPPTANAVLNGTYRPEGAPNSFSPFINVNAGTWTLKVADDLGGDTGTLTSWSLNFAATCTINGLPLPAVSAAAAAGGCATTAGGTVTAPTTSGTCSTLSVSIDGGAAFSVAPGASISIPAGLAVGQHTISYVIPENGYSATQRLTITDGNVPASCPFKAFSGASVGIPDSGCAAGNNGVSTINIAGIPAGYTPTSVNINITHTWDEDLDIFLVGPNGTVLELSTDNGGSGDNYTNTTFGVGVLPSIATGVAPFTGSFLPEGAGGLGVFNVAAIQANANGAWTLRVCDDTGGDVGTIVSWNISFSPPCNFSVTSLAPVSRNTVAATCQSAPFTLTAPNTVGSCASTTMTYSVDGAAPVATTAGSVVNVPALFPGAHTVVYALSNGNTLTQPITIVDNQFPVFTNCPANQVINLGPGACEAVYSFSPLVATDNCASGAPIVGFAGAFAPATWVGTNTGTSSINTAGAPASIVLNSGGTTGVANYCHSITQPGTLSFNWNFVSQDLSAVYDPFGYVLNGTFVQLSNGAGALNQSGTTTLTLAVGDVFCFRQNGDVSLATATTISNFSFTPPQVVIAQTAGFPSGTALSYLNSPYTYTFTATDPNGNVTNCSYTVTVAPFANAITGLACNDLVQISLDEACTATIGADQVLEGGPYRCYDTYIVELDRTAPYGNGPWGTPVVGAGDIGHNYAVRVTDPVTGNSCWGNVTIEDKLKPILECTNVSVPCNIASLDPLATPAPITLTRSYSADIVDDVLNDLQTNEYPVDVNFGSTINDVNLYVNIDGDIYFYNLTIELESPSGTVVTIWDQIGAGFGASGTMDATFDDEGIAVTTIAQLGAGNNVQILFNQGLLSDFDGENPQGQWIVRITDNDGFGDVTNINAFAVEINASGVAATGLPNGLTASQVTVVGPKTFSVPAGLIDACSAVTLTYLDTKVDEDCASGLTSTITRKWTATDASGNSTVCSQTISLFRAGLDDVVLPPNYDNITAPAVPCTANAYPTPEWLESQGLQGSPYVFGSPVSCSLGWDYDDLVIDVCDGTYKIRRKWTIIDWCTSEDFEVNQIIKVLDNAGPTFNCPANITVTTDAYQCCATVNLPDVIVSDNCSRISAISGMVVTFDPFTGEQTGMSPIGGALTTFPGNNLWNSDTLAAFGNTTCLPLGTHTVTYIAEDNCGNTSSCNFNITVRDLTPPVAVCDEYTVVAIGLDDPFDCYAPNTQPGDCSSGGVTWVKATTFDDGSYDNCGDVKFTVRRMASSLSDCILGLNQVNGFDVNGISPDGGAANCFDPFQDFPSEFERAVSDADSIKFYCCEVGTTQTVILSVIQLKQDGSVDFGADGQPIKNECMVQIEVQDKIKPACKAPLNVTVTCELFDPSLWAYGNAVPSDNCCLDTTKVFQGQCGLTNTVNYSQFDSLCNKGTITRNWTSYDCHGLTSTCSQKIIVTPNQNYYVKFPADKVVSVCDGTTTFGEPTFFGEDCELLATSFVDEVFTVVPDACYKIERTWTVINWCTYTPNAPCVYVPNPDALTGPTVSQAGNNIAGWTASNIAVGGTNFNYGNATNTGAAFAGFGGWTKEANCYKYKQIIKVIDTQDPTVVTPAPAEYCDYSTNDVNFWNAAYWWDGPIESHNMCEGDADITITATDACSGANISFRYLLFLDLDGNGSMETVVPGSPLPQVYNEVRYNNASTPNYAGGEARAFDFRAVPNNQKWGFGLQVDAASGNNRTAHVRWVNQAGSNAVPQLPYGNHKIKWFVEDGCGNEVVSETAITVKDCKKPTVVCINGLSINQMNGPMNTVTLWASDFLVYGEDNCTPSNLLKYGIRKSGTGSGFPAVNGVAQTSVTFGCTELGTQLVELWAEDKAGNADFCETYVLVQDNTGACGPISGMATVAGALKTEAVQGVEDAEVELNGSSNGTPMLNQVFTNVSGGYAFNNALPITANATVIPQLDADPLNGVNTWDLVLISRHILGLEPLNTPYKLIAADANKSGTVTTFDIVELRKLILGTYTALPNNTSWRFIDKGQVFTDNANPFANTIKESLQFASIQNGVANGDFVGAKVGDVDGTAVANQFVASDDRSAGTLFFDIADRKVAAGEEVVVNFNGSEKNGGFQFTMNFNGLEVMDIAPVANTTVDNFGVFANAITASADANAAFSVTFRATAAGQLSEMLSVSSRITKSEAYTVEGARQDVAFRFNGANGSVVGAGFELLQNTPNPVKNVTTVAFNLPTAAAATLTITNVEGRVIKSIKGDFAKGLNTVQISRSDLEAGILFYQVNSGDFSAVKKMIVVE